MIGKYSRAYFQQDPILLSSLRVPKPVEDAWIAHWKGDLDAASACYEQATLTNQPRGLVDIVTADTFLLNVKRGRYPESVPSAMFSDPGASFVYQYAIFSWFFWFDQRRSWTAMRRMLWFSLRCKHLPALQMSIFLLSHMLTIRGWHRIGFPVARRLYQVARRVFLQNQVDKFFFHRVAIASFAYTCLAARTSADAEGDVFEVGNACLGRDGYYRTIFDACALYNASYTGDIIRAQIYSEKLRDNTRSSQVPRYAALAEIMELLPYALQGYSHLISDRLNEVANRQSNCTEPLVRGQFIRVSALIELYRGNTDKALRLAQEASQWTAKLGVRVFWRDIDARIQDIAARGVGFGPKTDHVVPLIAQADQPVHLSEAVLELVSVCSQTTREDDDVFTKRMMAVVSRHIGSSEESTVHQLMPECIGVHPMVPFMGKYIEFESIPRNRRSFVRDQLSLLSPLLLGLVALRGVQRTAHEHAKSAAALKLAQQVAHDIRSPLAALKMIVQSGDFFHEDSVSLLKMAVSRIEEVANDLLDRRKAENHSQPPVVCMATIVTDTLEQKAMEYADQPNVQFSQTKSSAIQDCLARMEEGPARRVVSNIINNSVESLQGRGLVEVSVERTHASVHVIVSDNGHGMPAHVLERVRRESFSYGKKNGNGMGLSYAREALQKHGGSLQVDSDFGKGTTVHLQIPRHVRTDRRVNGPN